MKLWLRFASLLPLAALVGCTVPTSPITSPPVAGPATNWQIQAGTAITSPPNTYPSFLGAIQIQGTQASGVFTTVNSARNSAGLDYTGTYASATGDVNLATFGFAFSYTQPAAPYTLIPVGVIGGCVYPPGYPGPECLAIMESPSVGVEIAPLNGTYTGALINGSSPNLQNVLLTLTQSTTPNASGQFPLTATLVFLSNQATYPMTGAVSGEGLSLSYTSPTTIAPSITLIAATNPAATQITISSLTFVQTGPSYPYTGILTRQ